MPIMQIIPVEVNKLKLRGTIPTPVYMTQDRCNAMQEGIVFEANLNTHEHPSHWVILYIYLNVVDFARCLSSSKYRLSDHSYS